jgi:hypothetical protein
MAICESLKKNISNYGEEVHSFEDDVASTSTDKAVKLDKAAAAAAASEGRSQEPEARSQEVEMYLKLKEGTELNKLLKYVYIILSS